MMLHALTNTINSQIDRKGSAIHIHYSIPFVCDMEEELMEYANATHTDCNTPFKCDEKTYQYVERLRVRLKSTLR
jgi:hypothetical protein